MKNNIYTLKITNNKHILHKIHYFFPMQKSLYIIVYNINTFKCRRKKRLPVDEVTFHELKLHTGLLRGNKSCRIILE